MNSRNKGKVGEREAAKAWEEATGFPSMRGVQYSGSPDSPDILTDCADVHLEVKRCEKGNPYVWMVQSIRDSGDKCPVVLHRKNHQDWLVIVRLKDVTRFAKAVTAQTQVVVQGKVSGRISDPGIHIPG